MHTTHLMNEGNEKMLNQIGLNLTTDAKLPFPEDYALNLGQLRTYDNF